MSSKIPTTQQADWWSFVPHTIILTLLMLAWSPLGMQWAFAGGIITFLLLVYLLRNFVPRSHRAGMLKIAREDFENAILDFESSYDFFNQKSWVDKYRFVTTLTSSKITYREMALLNIAYCYAQLGNAEKAIEYYKWTLREFPESIIARNGLRMIESLTKKTED